MLKRRGLAAFVALSAVACQSPLVATRSYSFDTQLIVDAKRYSLTKDYRCHDEDVAWVSSRGKDWHVREGHDGPRLFARLDDGARLLVVPRVRPGETRWCPEKTQPLDVRVFVEADEATAESFDARRSAGQGHRVEVLDARIVRQGQGMDTFAGRADERAGAAPRRYYTIYAAFYARAAWKGRPEIDALIRDRRMIWFEDGKVYPYTSWSDDDVAFARARNMDARDGAISDAVSRIALREEEGVWTLAGDARAAVQWRVEPVPEGPAEEREAARSAKFRKWVAFGTSRIEVPLRRHYRIFYQPEYDRILELRVEHADLW